MKSALLWIFLFSLSIGISYGSFIAWKIYSTGKKVNSDNNEEHSFLGTVESLVSDRDIALKKSSDGRTNILLLGMAGKGKPGTHLTDTIMIASVNEKTSQAALLSIPRDFYVKINDVPFSNNVSPRYALQAKINSLYQYGLTHGGNDPKKAALLVADVVTSITDLPIDYYVILNFDGFEKVIDELGGINIINERDIYDPKYPGPNYGYETFELKKGFHLLDGKTALKYARERHNDPEGDFGRAKRQQVILQAAKNKLFSLGTLLNMFSLNDIFNALGDNIRTNIASEEIGEFLQLAKKLDTQNINNVVLDAWNKDSLLKVSHVTFQNARSFVLVPRLGEGNYREIQHLAQNIFDLNTLQRRRQEIAKEDAKLFLINKSGNTRLTATLQKLLGENLEYKNISTPNSSFVSRQKNTESRTTVYDFTEGTKPFTLDELTKNFSASLSPGSDLLLEEFQIRENPDIILVAGEDLIEKHAAEEGTREDLENERDNEEYLELTKNL